MSQTALLIKDRKIVIRTTPNPNNKLDIIISNANDEYIAQVDDQVQVFEHDDPNEEDFHRNLRLDAIANGHLIKQYCTDPEWSSPKLESNEEGFTCNTNKVDKKEDSSKTDI